MVTRISFALLAIALVAGLGGCAGRSTIAGDAGTKSETTAIAVGVDKAGEACVVQPVANTIDALPANRVFDLRCGSWPRPSGRLFELATGAGARTPSDVVQASPWRSDIDGRFRCGRPLDTKITGDLGAAWLGCLRRNGGLPHVAFAAQSGDKLYLADGLPPAQPALERATAVLSGKVQGEAAAAQLPPSSATELLEREFKGRALIGNADVTRYDMMMRLGRGFNNEGNYAQAEYYYREALALNQRLVGTEAGETAQPMMHLAVVLSNQQRFVDAQRLLDEAGRLLSASPDPAIAALYTYYQAIHAANQRRRNEALVLVRQSIEQFKAAEATGQAHFVKASDEDQLFRFADAGVRAGKKLDLDIGLIETASVAADLERRLNAVENSQQIVDNIRSTVERSRDLAPDSFANVLQISAENHISLGDEPRAEAELQRAVAALDSHFANTVPQVRAYFFLGRVHLRQGNLAAALGAFRTGATIARQRSFTLPPETVIPYLDALSKEIGRDPQAGSTLAAEMFEAAQLARSGTTAQLIADVAVQLAQGGDAGAAAIRAYRERQGQLEALQNRLDAEAAKPLALRDPTLFEDLVRRVKDAETRRDDAETQVQVLVPAFNLVRLKAVTVADVVKVLRPGEAFYTVLITDEGSYAFLLRDGTVSAYPIALTTASGRAAVDHLRDAFHVTGAGTVPAFDLAAAHALYKTLFGPAEDRLEGLRNLVIAQSGPLLRLPFAPLVTAAVPTVANNDYRKVPWLIDRFALTYATSTQSFVILRQGAGQGSAAPNPFIGFGDFVPPSTALIEQAAAGAQCAEDLATLKSLGALPGTRKELVNVALTFPRDAAKLVMGRDFTRLAVLDGDLGRYRILHFATHGLLPASLICRKSPSLLVSTDASSKSADVFLEAGDVLKLKLDADLVVLSACNTSSQTAEGSGESLAGLAQSFFIAGARGLVVSHWPAGDLSTQILMTRFYDIMGKSREAGAAEALRQAQRDLIANAIDRGAVVFSHPLFWSVFTLIGDGIPARLAPAA